MRKICTIAFGLILVPMLCISEPIDSIAGLVAAGTSSYQSGDFQQAIKCFEQALQQMERENASESLEAATSYYMIARAWYGLKDLPHTLPNLEKAAKLFRKLGDLLNAANAFNDIGSVQQTLSRPDEALEAYQAALAICLQLGRRIETAVLQSNIAFAYLMKGESDPALDFANAALRVLELEPEGLPLALCYQRLGLIMGAKKRTIDAIAWAEKATPLIEKYGATENIAFHLVMLGFMYLEINNIEIALATLSDALAAYREIGSLQGMAWCCDGLASGSQKSGNVDMAFEYYAQAISLRERQGDRIGLYSSYGIMASTKKDMGKLDEALELYAKALDVAQQLGDQSRVAQALGSIGNVHNSLGDYGSALRCFQNSLAINESMSRRSEVADNLTSIAITYFHQGFFDKAFEEYSQAFKVFEELHNENGMAMVNLDIGHVFAAWSQPNEALKRYQESLKLYEKNGDSVGILICLANASKALSSLNRYSEEFENLQRCLSISESLGIPEHIAGSYNNMGAFYQGLGRFDQALQCYSKSLDIFDRIGMKREKALASTNIGQLYLLLDQHSRSEDYLRKALELYESIGDQQGTAKALDALSAVQIAVGDMQSAVVALTRSIDLKERLRKTAPTLYRRDYLSAQFDSYQAITYALNAMGNANRALSYAELASTKTLLEQLNAGSGSTTEALPDVGSLLSEIDGSTLVIVYRNIDRCESLAFICFRGSIRKVLRFSKDSFTKRILDQYAQLLSIAPASNGSSSVKTTPVSPDPGMVAFATILLRYYQFLAQQLTIDTGTSAFEEIGRELYSLLLAPALRESSDFQKILIVPDGPLAFLPFEALPMPDGRYLVERFDVVYAPSLRVMQLASSRIPKTVRKGLLAIGGAVYQESSYAHDMALSDAMLSSLRASASAQLRGGADLHEFYSAIGFNSWSNLPGSLAEVKKIATFFDQADIRTSLQASESEVKSLSESGALHDYRILHFATHAFALFAAPELSAIVLSESSMSGTAQDGFLTQEEVAGLKTDADLVVLSACETGLGSYYRGEGMVGLIHAFLVAGSKGVCASLWQISDDATMQFMANLYQRIEKRGVGYAAALNQVKREFVSQGQYREPFYWAAFLYYGD